MRGKKLLSLLLALIFCLSLFPAAQAEEPGEIAPAGEDEPWPSASEEGLIAPAEGDEPGDLAPPSPLSS